MPKARPKFILTHKGHGFTDYSADIEIGKDKFLMVGASMPDPGSGGNSYLSLALDDCANIIEVGEVVISDDLFREITGHKEH
jgi:hypothetical protein